MSVYYDSGVEAAHKLAELANAAGVDKSGTDPLLHDVCCSLANLDGSLIMAERHLKHAINGWEQMTEEAGAVQLSHLDNHHGDVYHAMQHLRMTAGCPNNKHLAHQTKRETGARLDWAAFDKSYPSTEEKAAELARRGYIGVSNKYRILVRIDRPDWLRELARKSNRSVADFYLSENTLSGSTGRWGEYYARSYSKDQIEGIPEEVYRQVKRLAPGVLKYVDPGALHG